MNPLASWTRERTYRSLSAHVLTDGVPESYTKCNTGIQNEHGLRHAQGAN